MRKGMCKMRIDGNKMFISKDDLKTMDWMDFPYCMPEGAVKVSDTIYDHKRWTVEHELIFRLAGQPAGEAWRFHYSVGATESQDWDMFEYMDELECERVVGIERTTLIWKAMA